MFNIQVSKKDLSVALESIASTVGNNSQNLGDDCISITDMGTSTIELYTTNGIEFSRATIILSSASSGKITRMPFVNFKRFKSIIDSIPDGEFITIKSNVNDIEITYGMRKKPLKLTGAMNGIIPLPNFTTTNSDIIVEKELIKNVLGKACSIIKDENSGTLAGCMRINTNGADIEITAVDVKNNRIFLHKAQTLNNNFGDLLVEANKLKKAFKLFNDFNDIKFEYNANIIKISGSDPISNNVLLESEYYLRILSGTYPNNITGLFNNISEFAIVNKDEIKASLTRINAIEDTTIGSGTLDLSIDKNVVNLVKISQYGKVEDSFNAENEISYQIKDIFKVKSLAEILNTFADNITYNSPNTFEIGGSVAPNSNGKYYVLRETGSQNSMFLITGYTNNTMVP
jgi:hypothetical protein